MYVLHVNSCVLSCDLLLKYLIYFKKSTIKKKKKELLKFQTLI